MDSTIPFETSVEAEYADGYIHSETELNDVSAWGDGNVFRDILERRPEPEHGRMVRFSCFYLGRRFDVDWRTLPDNARPIRFRHGYSKITQSGDVIESGWTGVDFGCQWNEPDGSNRQEVLELRANGAG